MFNKFISASFGVMFFFISVFPVQAFSDTQDEAVNFLRTQQVFDKKLNFHPDRLAKRGEFVMWAFRNRDEFLDNERILEPFEDVVYPQKYAPYIARAWQLGAINTADNFYPFRSITRFEALKIALTLEGVPMPRAGIKQFYYNDLPANTADQAIISKALELRIVQAKSDNEFGTNEHMTRLEVAQLLYDLRVALSAQEMIYVQTFDRPEKEKEEIFDEIWSILHNKYLYAEDVDDEELMEAAINGMVDSMDDPHTVFFPKSDTEEFLGNLDGGLEGIGAQVDTDLDSGYVLIVAPLRDSPAEKNGLKAGDLIMEVNGKSVLNEPLEESISRIKGTAGTTVDLKIRRGTDEFNVEVTRGHIMLNTVFSREEDNYLIIEIILFGRTTITEIESALSENFNSNTQGVILDLRKNPGGFLDTALDVLGYFLPSGEIGVITNDAISSTPVKLTGESEYQNIPLVVLVDEYSASASEIVAGAIQDHNRGRVIGEKTYGKGTVQELVQFYDGSSFKVTIAEWKTPNKRSINNEGIEPDIIMEDADSEEIFDIAKRELRKLKYSALSR